MTVKIVSRSRQRDGTEHYEATAPAGTPVDDVVEQLMKQVGFHPESEGWGEIKDDQNPQTWTYLVSVEP